MKPKPLTRVSRSLVSFIEKATKVGSKSRRSGIVTTKPVPADQFAFPEDPVDEEEDRCLTTELSLQTSTDQHDTEVILKALSSKTASETVASNASTEQEEGDFLKLLGSDSSLARKAVGNLLKKELGSDRYAVENRQPSECSSPARSLSISQQTPTETEGTDDEKSELSATSGDQGSRESSEEVEVVNLPATKSVPVGGVDKVFSEDSDFDSTCIVLPPVHSGIRTTNPTPKSKMEGFFSSGGASQAGQELQQAQSTGPTSPCSSNSFGPKELDHQEDVSSETSFVGNGSSHQERSQEASSSSAEGVGESTLSPASSQTPNRSNMTPKTITTKAMDFAVECPSVPEEDPPAATPLDETFKEVEKIAKKYSIRAATDKVLKSRTPKNGDPPAAWKTDLPLSTKSTSSEGRRSKLSRLRRTPKSVTPKQSRTPKSVTPKQSHTPKSVTPKQNSTPKSVAPKQISTPKTVTPKQSSTPKTVTLKQSSTPKTVTPKQSRTPKSVTPKQSSTPQNAEKQEPDTPINGGARSKTSKQYRTPKVNADTELDADSSNRSYISIEERSKQSEQERSRGFKEVVSAQGEVESAETPPPKEDSPTDEVVQRISDATLRAQVSTCSTSSDSNRVVAETKVSPNISPATTSGLSSEKEPITAATSELDVSTDLQDQSDCSPEESSPVIEHSNDETESAVKPIHTATAACSETDKEVEDGLIESIRKDGPTYFGCFQDIVDGFCSFSANAASKEAPATRVVSRNATTITKTESSSSTMVASEANRTLSSQSEASTLSGDLSGAPRRQKPDLLVVTKPDTFDEIADAALFVHDMVQQDDSYDSEQCDQIEKALSLLKKKADELGLEETDLLAAIESPDGSEDQGSEISRDSVSN